jgi:hypothetical protein
VVSKEVDGVIADQPDHQVLPDQLEQTPFPAEIKPFKEVKNLALHWLITIVIDEPA